MVRFLGMVVLLFSVAPAFAGEKAKQKPNIILILADDLGYETIGANGGTSYKTPHLDRLAKGGARFTHAFAQPLCTPTRAQLMTGKSNIRNYVRFGYLDPRSITFANLLKNLGYATCVVGKWQLGQDVGLPKTFGFDESCLWQHTRRPPRYANPGLEYNGIEKNFTKGEYGPDILNDYAIEFITKKKNEPFFLYYPMTLTHSPYQATPDSKGWDPLVKDEKSNIAPRYFGDMVSYMDKLVGKVVAKLDELGIRNNTLVLFVGDNGTGKGTVSMMGAMQIIGGKGTTTYAGMHVPLIASWPGKIPAEQTIRDLVDTTDFLPTMMDAAGGKLTSKIDGRSFWPQLIGQKGEPRPWLYSWYSPRQGADTKVTEFAFTHRYKLYRTGEFYNLEKDVKEKNAIATANLSAEESAGLRVLQAALNEFRDARPKELDSVKEKKKGKAKAHESGSRY